MGTHKINYKINLDFKSNGANADAVQIESDAKQAAIALNALAPAIKAVNNASHGMRSDHLFNIAKGLGEFSKLASLDGVKISTAIKNISDGIDSVCTVAKSVDVTELKSVNSQLSGMANSITRLAKADITTAINNLNKFAEAQRENSKKAMEQAQTLNQQAKEKSDKDKSYWIDALMRGKWKSSLFGSIKTDESGGIVYGGNGKPMRNNNGLLSGMKGTIGSGIKGMLGGMATNAIFGGAVAAAKLAVKPLKMGMDLTKKTLGFLKGCAEQAETFKKLIELAVMPFVLFFTLLFAPVLQILAPILGQVIQVVADHQEDIMKIGTALANLIVDFFGKSDIVQTFSTLLERVIAWLEPLITDIAGVFDGLGVEEFGLAIATAFKKVLDWVVAFLYSGEGQMLMGNVIGGIALCIGELLEAVVKLLPIMLEALLLSIGGIITGFFAALYDDLGQLFWGWVDTVTANIDESITMLLGFLFERWTAISEWWESAKEWLNTVVFGFLMERWTSIANWWESTKEWLTTNIATIVGLIGWGIESLISGISGLWNGFIDYVKGIYNGAVNTAQNILEFGSNVINSIINFFKSAFQFISNIISDPSGTIGSYISDAWNSLVSGDRSSYNNTTSYDNSTHVSINTTEANTAALVSGIGALSPFNIGT